MKKKMNPRSLENLNPARSSDGAPDLVHMTVRVSRACKEYYDSLPGDRSSNVRAVLEKHRKEQNA